MKTAQIRRLFLDFFKNKGHTIVSSSSLVPIQDPTLLFVNAGMVQFKQVFLGEETRSYLSAASSQKCVRAGGKHNDLENVGFTTRHHTFFEMLGNFSFGDYFKREAIHYAWEFITEILKLPKDRLWITVFKDDQEAEDIWLNEIKIDKQRFSRCDEKDNFWSMGDTGPCGPCSEIFYDHGPGVAGGPPGTLDADGDRFVEIWNLVFMQYNRTASGSLNKLPKPSVDTGMGLERIAAVMQGVHSNYAIDIFKDLINYIANLTSAVIDDLNNNSLKVIADHIRASTFLIADGIIPSNEGRGYVLRRIIRRALRHGKKLGFTGIFFYKLVAPLVKIMGDDYSELQSNQKYIEKIIKEEEDKFEQTLTQGLKLLEQIFEKIENNLIPGDMVFLLYDTYGFPVDLIEDIAKERKLKLDINGFHKAMQKQKDQARQANKFTQLEIEKDFNSEINTNFIGYHDVISKTPVIEIFNKTSHKTTKVNHLTSGDEGCIILETTPFYAESGGQVGDTGRIIVDQTNIFMVEDTKKVKNATVHYGKVIAGTINVGDMAIAQIDHLRRQNIKLNHSATHLLHAALKQVLGQHVQQRGSIVEPDRLRFDFAHHEPVSIHKLQEIEKLVNEQIRLNTEVITEITSIAEAKAQGAIALFGEKYSDKVRMLSMGGDFSRELCGGTHVSRTGDIGLLKIINETGVASGVRRIEAITGNYACEWIAKQQLLVTNLCNLLKTTPIELEDRIVQLNNQLKTLEKKVDQLQINSTKQEIKNLLKQAIEIKGINILVAQLTIEDIKLLKSTVDNLKNQLGTAVIVLGVILDKKAHLISAVTKDCVGKIQANVLINQIADLVNGKGGGRPDMAQAGGTKPENLQQALNFSLEWIKNQL